MQQIEPVETAGAHGDHDLVGTGHGIGEVFDGHDLGATETSLDLRSHVGSGIARAERVTRCLTPRDMFTRAR